MNARRIIAVAGCTAALVAWFALGAGIVMKVERQMFVTLVFVAAIATEAMVWCMAAALGLTILQARRRIRQWVARRLELTFGGTSVKPGQD